MVVSVMGDGCAGRAGLGCAWQLVKQGYAVEVLEAGPYPGGLVAGWTSQQGRSKSPPPFL
jgi:uncharacterized protein with NAD-binding domain and iron-sulfur cluster